MRESDPRTGPPVGSPTVLLFPTELERRRVEDHGAIEPGLAVQALCGFGPVAAAARTAELIATLRPARVLLIGIAGAYDASSHAIGEAFEFDAVAIDGIGVGEGAALIAPPALGFPQWPGSAGGSSAIFDRLALCTARGASSPRLLLSTCAASADARQAAQRRERFPDAVAEDMEGFAVATACAMAGVPVRIVRGISNVVGDRTPGHWRIPAALAAARRLAIEILGARGEWPVAR